MSSFAFKVLLLFMCVYQDEIKYWFFFFLVENSKSAIDIGSEN